MNLNLSRNQWRAILGGIAAVTLFIATQPDDIVPPYVKLIADAVNIFVATVLKPGDSQ